MSNGLKSRGPRADSGRPGLTYLGSWCPANGSTPAFAGPDLLRAVPRVREPVHVVRDGASGALGLAPASEGDVQPAPGRYPVLATLPAHYPEWLGDRSFGQVHGARFPYIAGAMANGIATPRMVVAMARAGMIGFYGAGGLGLEQVDRGLFEIRDALGADAERLPWGSNLIHSPAEPELEQAVADLYLRRGVRRVSASAYMRLTPAVVRYAASGLSLDPSGAIRRTNHLFAKVSREEVARLFMAPPPQELLDALVRAGQLGREEASLAARLPLCEDITVEADSGGHTDNRPLTAILPVVMALRDRLVAGGQGRPIRVGAAGGLGSPPAVAAAFAMGAAYVLTGTVNQAAQESGLSAEGRALLAEAGVADVAMAPSPDMFELGVKVQVLRRGTLFSTRAARLYELYRSVESLEAIPDEERARLERELFQAPLEQIWHETREFFGSRSPAEVDRAGRDPRHRMALVFRWYLGRSSRWAIEGQAGRRLDYQIWCGPAIGAFNAWTAGSFLARPENRTVDQIARNLLEGAAVVTRAQQLRSYGVPVPAAAFDYRPRPLR